MHLGNLSCLSNALSRSISPENFTGEKGKGGMSVDGPAAPQARGLGQGWNISPYVTIEPGVTFTLADIDGQGAIQQIWMTIAHGRLRHCILRVYWDNQAQPSVECPVGDFFACGWEEFAQVSSLAVCVNPGRAFNCYWEMPFRKRARFTLENRGDEQQTVYYQINYTLTDVPEDCAYFHAQFRRTNPVPYKQVHTILDGVSGAGQYVGTYMAWGVNNNGWWGEGEIKFYMDGDGEFPTICGTGTEDYFCGAYNIDPHVPWRLAHPGQAGGPRSRYLEFNTPYAGLPQVIRLMACIGHNSALACTAGKSPIRCASKRTCVLRCRRSAGAQARKSPLISRSGTTWHRSRSGTRRCPQLLFPSFLTATTLRSIRSDPE